MTLRSRRSASQPLLLAASLPSTARSAREARARLREALADRCAPDVVDTVMLLTTELVSNAVACDSDTVDLQVAYDADGLRVEVTDADPSLPTMADRGLEAERGRGLHLVSSLADAWGCIPSPPGKVMWFALKA